MARNKQQDKNRQVKVMLSPALFYALRDASGSDGLSLAEYVRRSVASAIRRGRMLPEYQEVLLSRRGDVPLDAAFELLCSKKVAFGEMVDRGSGGLSPVVARVMRATLTEDQHAVVLAIKVHGRKDVDFAVERGVTKQAVGQLLRRAVARLERSPEFVMAITAATGDEDEAIYAT